MNHAHQPQSDTSGRWRPLLATAGWFAVILFAASCLADMGLPSFSKRDRGPPTGNEVVATESPAESSVGLGGLITSLTIFVLAVFVGFEVIAKVPPTLHTPLMSGSNAISGITVIGALVAAGAREEGIAGVLGMIAVALAMINVVGGFAVTHRMLQMFKKK